MKEIDDPDPMNSAKRLVMWTTNPQQYALTYFPEIQPQMPAPPGEGAEPDNEMSEPESLSAPPASASLSNVPISNPGIPQ